VLEPFRNLAQRIPHERFEILSAPGVHHSKLATKKIRLTRMMVGPEAVLR
jgi:hypothetical protein